MIGLLIILAVLLPACNTLKFPDNGRLNAVATTNIVGDVVAQISGSDINLITLLPPGADPHGYEPTSQDLRAIADADIVFMNGLGLEEFLEDMLIAAGGDAVVVALSESVEVDADHTHTESVYEEAPAVEIDDDHDHGGTDPHVWFDVRYVIAWTVLIADQLAALDIENADNYQARSLSYIEEIETLDAWIHQQVQSLPIEQRVLVTNHDSFTYFAAAYQFEIVGAVIAGKSTMAEPSARELAALQGIVAQHNVQAIFVEVGVSQTLAGQVAADTGIILVELYTGSLSESDGPADSYLAMMRYNVSAIVKTLSE